MAQRSGAGGSDRRSPARSRMLIAGASALALVASVGICGTALTGTGQATPPKRSGSPSRTPLRPALATGAFGLDLMRTQRPGNLVLSPDSVAAALAMTGTGAAGSTAAQIVRTLHLDKPAGLSAMGNLQRAVATRQASIGQGHPKAPTLDIANGLFLQQGFPIEPTFLSGLQQHFAVAPEAVDFAGDSLTARDTINDWASEHTRGLIPRLLNSVPAETRLALANAVYLKASWRHPFGRSGTSRAPFHTGAGRTSTEFMHQTKPLRYGSGRSYRAVALPYRASTLSLLVVLPRGRSIGALQRQLDGRGLARIARHLSLRPVRLSLPRFHLKTQASLVRPLESLGMTAAFSDAADFSRITTATRLKIEFVEHAADFTVDEDGTVAAAATVVGAVQLSGQVPVRNAIEFNANRPFLFFLRDNRTGAVLFAGRLTNPASAGNL